MSDVAMRFSSRLGAGLVLCALVVGCGERGHQAMLPERLFASAEEAAAALVGASEKYDVPEMRAILGAEGEALVTSEDTILDRNNAVAFAAEARVQQRLEYDESRKSAVLSVGAGDWPLPIPIVEQGGKWYFDAEAGREEVLRRRIGRNELDAIEVCRDYVAAQRAYALEKHDGAMVNQYAQRVISTPGKQDGLAWRTADGTVHGPLGETIAQFIAEGYRERYEPFHGYYFKILKGQGPAALLGEMDFMVKGAMIGGFAMVATPAEYMVTGVKSFLVSHDGVVYEKDLGEQSVELFRAMERYDPDSTWKPVQDD